MAKNGKTRKGGEKKQKEKKGNVIKLDDALCQLQKRIADGNEDEENQCNEAFFDL